MISPRKTASRSERAMALALFYASFSKDPNTQIGAVIVNDDNELISAGYNGPSKVINDDEINWSREPDEYGLTKYSLMNHAEKNAIRYAKGEAKGCILYVTGMPCSYCMNDIVTDELKKVIYFPHKASDPKSMFNNQDIFKETKRIAELGHVELEEFIGDLLWAKNWVGQWPDSVYSHAPLLPPVIDVIGRQ